MNIVMIQNRAMLGLPEITPMNFIIARALLEILIASARRIPGASDNR